VEWNLQYVDTEDCIFSDRRLLIPMTGQERFPGHTDCTGGYLVGVATWFQRRKAMTQLRSALPEMKTVKQSTDQSVAPEILNNFPMMNHDTGQNLS
jgi:hypothetical protein